MDYPEDRNARRKLRLAILFATLVFILVFAAAHVALYHSPSHVVFIVVGVAGLALNVVIWVLLSRKVREQGRKTTRLTLSFVAASLASAAAIAYGCGETHFPKFALYIAIACFLVSPLFNRRGKTDIGIENEKR